MKMSALKCVIVAVGILLSAPFAGATETVQARPAAVAMTAPSSAPARGDTATTEETQRYAAREQSSRALDRFEGGRWHHGYVAVPIGVVVLAVVLILVLL